MFFEEPGAAFARLRQALRPGARLGFVCWQPPEVNPWVHLPLSAVRKIAPEQPLPPLFDPGKPGPFAFSDPAFVRAVLRDAGFEAIEVEPREHHAPLGGAGTLDQAVDFTLELGPAARFVSEAEPALVPAMRAAVRDALSPLAGENGVVIAMRTLLVTARR
jgi:hypothetical protein